VGSRAAPVAGSVGQHQSDLLAPARRRAPGDRRARIHGRAERGQAATAASRIGVEPFGAARYLGLLADVEPVGSERMRFASLIDSLSGRAALLSMASELLRINVRKERANLTSKERRGGLFALCLCMPLEAWRLGVRARIGQLALCTEEYRPYG